MVLIPFVFGAIQRNVGDTRTTVLSLSEAHVYYCIKYPNYSFSDASPKIALLLMAVFCKCRTKIYMRDGRKRENN